MADGAERQNSIEPGVYDPRRDANWQARLEEARAKREIALREKRATGRPKKRLKPWEEEGAVVLDDDADFTPQSTGLNFSDRVDAMRRTAAPVEASPTRPAIVDPAPHEERPGSNWSPDADQNVLKLPTREERVAETAEPKVEAPRPTPVSKVNDIFSDPAFNDRFETPQSQDDSEPETIPIALLRVPPPEPPRRRLPEPEERTISSGVTEEVVAPRAVSAKPAKKKRSGLWGVAALFAAAIAIGPIYKMSQPVERGPLVFTLSSFPIQPAFGLTSPMFETPTPTRSREWTPASLAPTDEPLALAKPNVPERAREIVDFAVDPVFGADVSGILLGRAIEALPDTPAEQPLPTIMPERPIGPDGQVPGIASILPDVPLPAPRPLVPAEG